MSARLRVLVVDDARLARREMQTLLAAMDGVECIGEADDVPAAREALARLHPDVVLLDIQMPSGSGFDVLDGLQLPPSVIFTTAYDHYAVQAFDANALDYLLKPVEASRLQAALDKARARMTDAAPSAREGGAVTRLGAEDTVFLRDGERCWFVALGEISRIVVDGNYARLWFRGQNALLSRSLAALEDVVTDDAEGDVLLDPAMIEMMFGVDSESLEVISSGGSIPSEAVLQWAHELELGNWFALDYQGRVSQVQYVWCSRRGQLHLFAASHGKSYLVQTTRMASYLQAGLLVQLEDEALTVRATRAALAKLNAEPDRLVQ